MKVFEPQHWSCEPLYPSLVLLDDVGSLALRTVIKGPKTLSNLSEGFISTMIKNILPFAPFSTRRTRYSHLTLRSNDAFLLVFFILPSLLMGLIAGIPKLLILYGMKPKGIRLDKNMFFCILAGEILIFTFAFFTSHPLFDSMGGAKRDVGLLSFIDSLSTHSLLLALFIFKVFLIQPHFLSFLLALFLFWTPAYAFVSFFMHKSLASYFHTIPGYILYTLTFPLAIILAIGLSPYVWEKHKEFRDVPFTTTNERNMALYHAVHEGMPHLVSGLLENGADVNFKYWKGREHHDLQAPLLVAFRAKRNLIETTKILIDYGADVNALEGAHVLRGGWTSEGNTPYLVHLVKWRDARHINHELIDLLIESGANVAATDPDGHTYDYYLNKKNKKNPTR